MSRMPALRAYTTITSTHWAMTQEYIELMADIALRENDPIEAVERKLGRRLENTREVTVRDGVATIPVLGPIFRYADYFTAISGGATVEAIAQDLTVALEDPAVRAIVLYIDSPGGEINGINELGDMIYAARGVKPVTAYGSFLMASAAYWLGSAADRIILDASALTGSIGVRTAVRDPSKTPSRTIEFISSQSPGKRADPTTDAGRAAIQTEVDRLADVFIGAVARNRRVSTGDVVERFGRGGLVIGADAVAAGMADALGSYEGVLAGMAGPARPSLFVVPPFAATTAAQPTEEPPMPPEEQTTQATEAELTQLRQQLAAEREKRISAEAAAFAEARIAEHKLMPGERGAIVALYQAVARDDADHPRAAGPRVDLLAAAFTARPAHGLTVETVPATPSVTTGEQQPQVIANKTETPQAGATAEEVRLKEEAAANAKAYAERRNGAAAKK